MTTGTMATVDVMTKKRCAYSRCREWFDPVRSDQRFHTSGCRVNAYREEKHGQGSVRDKKHRRRCDVCDKSYWTAQPDRSKYCSEKCRMRAHYLRQKRDAE